MQIKLEQIKNIILLLVYITVINFKGFTQQDAKNLFLWKLETPKTIFHLFGSIHYGREDIYPLDERIEQAFIQSHTLIVEVNTLKADVFETMGVVMDKAIYGVNDSLDKHIPQKTLEKLEVYLKSYQVQLDMVLPMKPWLVEQFILSLKLKELGFREDLGLDIYYMNKADTVGKPILELETAIEQIDYLSGIPDNIQALSLEYNLIDLENMDHTMDMLFSLWLNGRVEEFEEFTLHIFYEEPQFMLVFDILIVQRNLRMADKIEKWIEQGGNYFLVVGAGHLIGEYSIIEMLKDRGYYFIQY